MGLCCLPVQVSCCGGAPIPLTMLSACPGELLWRRVLERGAAGRPRLLLPSGGDLVTYSGPNLLRVWSAASGQLVSETALDIPDTAGYGEPVNLLSAGARRVAPVWSLPTADPSAGRVLGMGYSRLGALSILRPFLRCQPFGQVTSGDNKSSRMGHLTLAEPCQHVMPDYLWCPRKYNNKNWVQWRPHMMDAK